MVSNYLLMKVRFQMMVYNKTNIDCLYMAVLRLIALWLTKQSHCLQPSHYSLSLKVIWRYKGFGNNFLS